MPRLKVYNLSLSKCCAQIKGELCYLEEVVLVSKQYLYACQQLPVYSCIFITGIYSTSTTQCCYPHSSTVLQQLPVLYFKPVLHLQVTINIEQINYRPIKRLRTTLGSCGPKDLSPFPVFFHNLNHVSVFPFTFARLGSPQCQPVCAPSILHPTLHGC